MGDAMYELRVEGTLSDEVLDAVAEQVEGLTVSLEPVVTVLQGPVADQAALHGLLARLGSLGAEVVEVRRLPVDEERPG